MKSLRWMKQTQNKDGSWGNRKVAYTGLALLAYLGHCETPRNRTARGDKRRAAVPGPPARPSTTPP